MAEGSSAPTTGGKLTIDGFDGIENVRAWTGPQSNAQLATSEVYSQRNNGETVTLGGDTVAEVGPYTASMIVAGAESIRAAKELAKQCAENPQDGLDLTVTEEGPDGSVSTVLRNAFVKVDAQSLTANSQGIQEVTLQITALEKDVDNG